ncbi:MAG: putative transcriptional regulator [Candidatus Nanosalina sp. J07AB43]|nr:MAG: putative transcriptional regulator [Candidatus Nanosalina sp. J07AB43]
MSTREQIVNLVRSRRGMSFSKLKEYTDAGNGTIQYHINESDKLERKRDAVVHKQRCKGCPVKQYCSTKCIIKLLENYSRRQVAAKRAEGMSYSEIADEVGIDKSTVSYHISLLPDLNQEGFQESLQDLSILEEGYSS